MRNILKWSGLVLGTLLVLAVAAGLILHKPRPDGNQGPEAEALARRIMDAVDKVGWDTTGAVQWNFKGMHDFLWDRDRRYCRVRWGATEVLLNLNDISGQASKNGVPLNGEERTEAVQTAWSYFCNDSFWLNAPVKIFDPDTERRLVTLSDGRQGLLVTFKSGGVTPGDSYLWMVDKTGLPQRWKMWVSIIPIGGVSFRPGNWVTLPTGARIATRHEGVLLDLDIRDLRGAAHLEELVTEDPFAALGDR